MIMKFVKFNVKDGSKIAYEGTRDICSRIACKLKNAINDYYINGVKNEQLGITDSESAEHRQLMFERMEEVATTGIVKNADWEAIRLALSLNGELLTATPERRVSK
jgi:hypothetical protein